MDVYIWGRTCASQFVGRPVPKEDIKTPLGAAALMLAAKTCNN